MDGPLWERLDEDDPVDGGDGHSQEDVVGCSLILIGSLRPVSGSDVKWKLFNNKDNNIKSNS